MCFFSLSINSLRARVLSYQKIGVPEGGAVSPSDWGSPRAGPRVPSEEGSLRAWLGLLPSLHLSSSSPTSVSKKGPCIWELETTPGIVNPRSCFPPCLFFC